MNEPEPFPTPTGTVARILLHPEEFGDEVFETLSRLAEGFFQAAALVALTALGLLVIVKVGAWVLDRRLVSNGRVIRVIPPPEVDAKGAQVFWMGMLALLHPWWKRLLLGQPFVVWQIVGRHEEISISVWVPNRVPPGLIERTIETAWPGTRAIVEKGESKPEGEHLAVCDLGLAQPQWHPIGSGPDSDPLKLALSSLTSLQEDETAVVQVLARPVISSKRKGILKAAAALRNGVTPGRFIRKRAHRQSSGFRPQPDPWIEGEVREIVAKGSSPLFSSIVRVAATAPHREIARGRIHALAGAFAIFEGRNGFRRRRSPLARYRLPRRIMSRPYLLSVPELSLIGTLPAAGSVTGLERAGVQPVAPAKSVSYEGKVLGVTDWSGGEREVAITTEDARHHIHMVGETGTGKSTLLANMILDDARHGRAAVVIDPKGDLVEAVLQRLPDGAEERTCVLDPEDGEWAVGLDPLRGADEDLVVDQITGAFKRIYEHHWGPRTDFLMRICLLTLRQIPGATLTETGLLLMNFEWRRAVRSRLTHIPMISEFWAWYDRLNEQMRSEYAQSLLNKLSAFDLRGRLRLIVGQSKPRRNIENLVDLGGLLLVRVPKGTLGEETSRLLGALVIARIWQKCMTRSAVDESERRDVTLYVDEMHNYLALPRSFQDLLAEARGYRLSLVLAHQHMAQLPREMREALAANARTKISFAISPEDAHGMEKHFLPEINSLDLSHLSAFQAACRPCIAGGHGRAFTFKTRPLSPGSKERVDQVRNKSASMFARRADELEKEIRDRHRYASAKLLPDEVRVGSIQVRESPDGSGDGSGVGSGDGPSPGGVSFQKRAGGSRK